MFYSSDPTSELAAAGHAASGDTASSVPDDDRELQVLSIVHGAQGQADPEAAPNTDPDAHSEQDHAAPARVSQRSIAQALGMSVGLTNAILKRLTDKGFLMMRRINTHNVHYLVTPAGVDLISRRSYLYLRRTIGHVVRYKERLREFCRTQRDRGIREIVLIGESDLTFILEWCAEKEGVGFRQVERAEEKEGEEKNAEPSGSVEAAGSEDGPQPHRVGGAQSPPAHAGTVYLLSELHPEPPSDAPRAAIPLHEIVLGKR